ncbi:MAG: TraR/DksA family transcriptional regulator [Bacteroidetes bacterium]|nr:MAG: TraR/DksA family transcriptional regulator [Bacteroidota bacterium]
MNNKELGEIEVLLKREIDKTTTSVAEYKELTQPIEPDDAIGRISRMDAINNKSINEAALRTAVLKLNRLKDVLSKLHDKDFGVCRKCSKPIPIQRILLVPQAPFCVNCAQ